MYKNKYYMSQKQNNSGIVYVLTNPAMPGLVKIGMTTRDNLDARMKELYGTGFLSPLSVNMPAR